MDLGTKEELASYREEDAAKTGHAVGSRGPGGGNEQRAHGQRRFMGGSASRNIRVFSTKARVVTLYNPRVVKLFE